MPGKLFTAGTETTDVIMCNQGFRLLAGGIVGMQDSAVPGRLTMQIAINRTYHPEIVLLTVMNTSPSDESGYRAGWLFPGGAKAPSAVHFFGASPRSGPFRWGPRHHVTGRLSGGGRKSF